jgi:hypothetical protein
MASFNDTTNKNGIIQQIEQVTKLGDGAISGNALLLKEFTNRINNWLNIANIWIQEVSGVWPYDDQNHGNLQIEEFNFVDNQPDYGISTEGESDLKQIRKVEVYDVSTSEYVTIPFLEEKDRPDNEFGEDKDMPSSFYLNGGSIIFYSKPDITKSTKYRLTYDRNAHLFLSTDLTAVPGFDLSFHPILVFGPTMEWALSLGRAEVVALCKEMLYGTDPEVNIGLKRQMQKVYSKRLIKHVPKIGRKSKSYV